MALQVSAKPKDKKKTVLRCQESKGWQILLPQPIVYCSILGGRATYQILICYSLTMRSQHNLIGVLEIVRIKLTL